MPFGRLLPRLAMALFLMVSACGSDDQPATPREPAPAEVRTPEQMAGFQADLEPVLRRDTVGLTVVTSPDGSQMIDLQGRFQHATVARRNADGTITQSCVDEVQPALRFLAGGNAAEPHAAKEQR